MTNTGDRVRHRLRAYEARLPDADAPGSVRAGRGRRLAWPIFATAAAAVVVGTLLAVLLLSRPESPVGEGGPSPSPTTSSSPTPEPSASSSGSPGPAQRPMPSETAADGDLTIAWETVANVVGEGQVRRVTAESGRFFALGSKDSDAAIWSSDDGTQWDHNALPFPSAWDAEPPVFVSAGHILAVDDRFVAIGTVGALDNLNAVVWESTDGVTWTEIETGSFMSEAYSVQDATTGPGGIVALTHRYGMGTGSAWRSEDGGHTWTEYQPDRGHMAGYALVGTNSVYVMAGVGYDPEYNASPRIWTSPDGAAWAPATVEGSDGTGSVDQVTVNGDGVWVATGSLDGRLVAWRSDDALTWSVAFDFAPQPADGYTAALLAGLPDGFVAVSLADGLTTWTSTDGRSWVGAPTERPTVADGGTAELSLGVGRVDDRIVLVGPISTPANPAGDTWHSWVGTIER